MLSGFHHIKLPVSEVARSRDWYTGVLGFTTDIEFVEDGVLMGVGLAHAGMSGGIALRHDPERAKALNQDVLFYVRQKHQDLLTQLAVSIQNYLAIDIVIKNNIELIKGVDRASTIRRRVARVRAARGLTDSLMVLHSNSRVQL